MPKFASAIKKNDFLVKLGNELQLTAKQKSQSEKNSLQK